MGQGKERVPIRRWTNAASPDPSPCRRVGLRGGVHTVPTACCAPQREGGVRSGPAASALTALGRDFRNRQRATTSLPAPHETCLLRRSRPLERLVRGDGRTRGWSNPAALVARRRAIGAVASRASINDAFLEQSLEERIGHTEGSSVGGSPVPWKGSRGRSSRP